MGLLDTLGTFANPIGSAIGGIANIVGTSMNNSNQKKMLNMQIDAQRDLQDSQNTWNETMWNKNNEYNSPENQRQLWEDAGFNPALMMGGSSPISSGSATSSAMPFAPGINPAGDFSHMGSNFADIMLTLAQVGKTDADKGLIQAKTVTENTLRDSQKALNESLAKLNDKQREEYDAMIGKLQAETSYTKALEGKTEDERKLIQEQTKWLPIMNNAELHEIDARIVQMLSDARYNDAQIAYLHDSRKLIASQIRLNSKQESLIDSEIDYNQQLATESSARTANESAKYPIIKNQQRISDVERGIAEDTQGSETFGRNARNYTGPFIDIIHSGVEVVGAVNETRSGMAKQPAGSVSSTPMTSGSPVGSVPHKASTRNPTYKGAPTCEEQAFYNERHKGRKR